MKRVCIIGAGQLGSRHLQALHAVREPLDILVIDPSEASRRTAEERYASLGTNERHTICFAASLETAHELIDIAIVATNSNARRLAVEALLAASDVRYLILEKLLFQRQGDYAAIEKLIAQRDCRAWVNCSMRTMPFYAELREQFRDCAPIQYHVTGSQYGLITNAIHYIDYLSFLIGRDDAVVLTDGLTPATIESKRKGFLELNGTLRVRFGDGSEGSFTCYEQGTAPILVEIFNRERRVISRESEQRAWVAAEADAWRWQEIVAPIPFQSAMTTAVVEQLLTDGTCQLAPYALSAKMHLQLLDPLQAFLRDHNLIDHDRYPFT